MRLGALFGSALVSDRLHCPAAMMIENLTVDFPYNNLYPEQHQYMRCLKQSLDERGHCLLQMPPGTGKTVALLSLITSYNQYSRTSSPPINLVYCTRTVHDIAKTLNELQLLYNYQGKKNYSPDYLAPGIARFGNVVVCTYHYMLNPKLALDGIISEKELGTETVIVFYDEANNLDNECIEALSFCVTRQTLEGVSGEIDTLTKLSNAATAAGRTLREEDWPGNIRQAEHFLPLLHRLVHYLQGRLGETTRESPAVFLSSICNRAFIPDKDSLRFCYERLRSLMLKLAIDKDELLHTRTLCSLVARISANYDKQGFSILVEHNVLHLRCLDASLAIKPVFERFQSVVITSGTLTTPTDHLYPRLLGFNPVVNRSFEMSMPRDCICPMVVNPHGGSRDQALNYGKLLLEIASVVPDGILCSFESYLHMDRIISAWNETGILKHIMQHKLLFIETQDVVDTTLAVENYRRACDCGRGAVFLSVAGGKVARGIAFDRHYGRLVILFGIPFYQKNNNNTTASSRILCARLDFLRVKMQIKEEDFLTFDSARQAAQCVVDLGRVLHSKADYGMMIFADDKRYSRRGACSKLLPGWIVPHLRDAHLNLSTDMALQVARDFLGKMALPPSHDRKTRLSREDLDDDPMIY